jgi:hypothetical protein
VLIERLPGAARSGALGSLIFEPACLPGGNYLKRQGRFAHLLAIPHHDALIAEVQADVDTYWAGVSRRHFSLLNFLTELSSIAVKLKIHFCSFPFLSKD